MGLGVVQCNSPLLYSVCLSSGVCWNHHINRLCLRQATITSRSIQSKTLEYLKNCQLSHLSAQRVSLFQPQLTTCQCLMLILRILMIKRNPGIPLVTGNHQIAMDREGKSFCSVGRMDDVALCSGHSPLCSGHSLSLLWFFISFRDDCILSVSHDLSKFVLYYLRQ